MTPQDFVWQEVQYEIFCTREEFDAVTKDFEFIPIGNLDGVLMLAGTEGHLYGKLSVQVCRKALKDVLEKHGKATCRCPKKETKGRRILEIFGFKIVNEDDLDYFYEVTK